MTITIEILIGKNASEYIEYVSHLRINIFKEYPYLYQGDLEYEKKYVADYTLHNQAMIAIAKIDGLIAGISTGIPVISDSKIAQDVKEIFTKQKTEAEKYYYYGEIMILPEFRGKGLATKLYSAQDKIIKEWGFEHACILTVIRENDHPLKPKCYNSPNSLWKHLGFFQTGYKTNLHWQTIQSDGNSNDASNTLELWSKKI